MGDAKFPSNRHSKPYLSAQPKRGNTHFVTGTQTVLRRDAPAVDAYLAAPEDPIDVAFRHALADAQQEIIYTLSFRLFADHPTGNGSFA